MAIRRFREHHHGFPLHAYKNLPPGVYIPLLMATDTGPRRRMLREPDVSDVLVDGSGIVHVERAGRLEPTGVAMAAEEVLAAVGRVITPLGLLATMAITRNLFPGAEGSGVPQSLASIKDRSR